MLVDCLVPFFEWLAHLYELSAPLLGWGFVGWVVVFVLFFVFLDAMFVGVWIERLLRPGCFD